MTGRGSRGPNPADLAVNTFGCQVAQVAVDTATGVVTVERIVAVHDVGRIINPMGARSQAQGGVLQGIGFALTEERVVDPTTGTVVNAGLEDYKIPTMADTPEIVCEFVDDPDPSLPLGIKGLGEPPIIPTAGAIGNAIAHATGRALARGARTPRDECWRRSPDDPALRLHAARFSGAGSRAAGGRRTARSAAAPTC